MIPRVGMGVMVLVECVYKYGDVEEEVEIYSRGVMGVLLSMSVCVGRWDCVGGGHIVGAGL